MPHFAKIRCAAVANICVLLISAGTTLAGTIYPDKPDWASTDAQIGTGAALVDLNRDGWPDIVVSNGNDIFRENVVVFYNRGDGTFNDLPDWVSDDVGYHGHLDIADVNGDGWPDVAVAMLLNEDGPAAKLYLNHEGTLSSTPDWVSDEKARAFGVAFGDMNNDGRPDLAIATGWPYDPGYDMPTFVHLNIDGALETTASWQSDDKYNYMGVLWVDADSDGWLDLVGAGAKNASYIYRNLAGTLDTKPTWDTGGVKQFAIMAAAGDVTGEGLRDLFITDNTQVFQGSGYFRQFTGAADGFYSQSPNWKYYDGYGSAVALADVNADGLLDLVTGAWWDQTRVFLNNGSGLPTTPTWSSTNSTVVEKIVLGDVNRDGLYERTECFAAADGFGRLLYLASQPIERVLRIDCDGNELDATQYMLNAEHGWLTVGVEYDVCCVTVLRSSRLDLVESNWDGVGAYVYLNRQVIRGDANCDGRADFADIDPFVQMLIDLGEFHDLYPGCAGDQNCDLNGDGLVNFDDIDGFVECLINGGCA